MQKPFTPRPTVSELLKWTPKKRFPLLLPIRSWMEGMPPPPLIRNLPAQTAQRRYEIAEHILRGQYRRWAACTGSWFCSRGRSPTFPKRPGRFGCSAPCFVWRRTASSTASRGRGFLVGQPGCGPRPKPHGKFQVPLGLVIFGTNPLHFEALPRAALHWARIYNPRWSATWPAASSSASTTHHLRIELKPIISRVSRPLVGRATS